MKITHRLSGDANVLCIACSTFRRLGHMVADLDGPAFVAYFCYTTRADGHVCVPASRDAAETLYRERGYRRTAPEDGPPSGQWRNTGQWRKTVL